MAHFDRLEDVALRWRTDSGALVATTEAKVLAGVRDKLPERVDVLDPVPLQRIGAEVRDTARDCVRESILPACLRWLREQGHWADDEVLAGRVRNEIAGNLEGLAPFEPHLPAPSATIRNSAWVLTAAAGAALGALALAPLTLLVLDSRPIGLLVGGVLGAAGLVGLVGYLASKAAIVAGLEKGLKWFGILAIPVGLWGGLRGRPLAWLRAGAYTLASWLLLVTVRPRAVLPSRDAVLAALGEQVRPLLLHDFDLILAWCWAHPDRLGRPAPELDAAPALPGPVCDALVALRLTLNDPASGREDFGEAAAALLQRVEAEGYEWKTVERGKPYEEWMAACFSKFGMIDVGQPVETLKPAFVRQGTPIQTGVLRRVRAQGG